MLDNFDAVLILERLSTEGAWRGQAGDPALARRACPRAYRCTRSTKGVCGSGPSRCLESTADRRAGPVDLELYSAPWRYTRGGEVRGRVVCTGARP